MPAQGLANDPPVRHSRRLAAIVLTLPLLLLVSSSGAAAGPNVTTTISGTVVLKPLRIAACKSAIRTIKGEKRTYIQCGDTGVFNGRPRRSGASYGWTWVTNGQRNGEEGNLGINFGTGVVYLHLVGNLKPIGTPTKAAGKSRSSGTWTWKSGTGAYKARRGSGRYTMDLVRNATRYLVLKIHLSGTLK